MAYQGYLLKIGDWEFPLKYIRAETYVALRSGQDLDSYRDADGNLHRTALDNFLYKIEFETPPMMTDADYEYIWSQLQARYINSVDYDKYEISVEKGEDYLLHTGDTRLCNAKRIHT